MSGETVRDRDWYVQRIRRMLADHDPARNHLDGHKEHWSDDDLEMALDTALIEFNSLEPVTDYPLEGFIWPVVLLYGGVYHALRQASVSELKNQLSYSDAGQMLQVHATSPQYEAVAAQIYAQWDRLARKAKATVVARSPGAGFIGIPSPYGYFDGYFDVYFDGTA